MKRSKSVLAVLLLCILFSLASPFASAGLEAPHLKSSDAYLVVDMKTGTELLSLNPDMHHSIASLTKIMTCLLGVEAVENGKVSLEDMVTAPEDCLQGLDVSSSNAGITPGEIMSYQDLLYCALVHSANDACNVIAAHVAGSIGAFVQQMNARAAELGCMDTQFIDTDGMLNRSDGHYSSPRDLYRIACEAMKHPLFAKICGTADYTVSETNKREAFEVHNSNALMSDKGIYGEKYMYSGVVGIKTGFTKPAGYCLVSVCERNGDSIMCIVLGCNGPLTYTSVAGEYQNFMDSATLYDWVFRNFSSRTVFLAGEPLKRLSVKYAKDNGTVALCPDQSLNMFLANEIEDKEINVEIHPDEEKLVAPITEGQELGYADVYIRGELKTTVKMLADASVEMARSEMIKAKIKAFFGSVGFKIAVIVLVLAVVLFFALKSYRKAVRRRILRAKLQERDRAKWTEEKTAYTAKEEARRRAAASRGNVPQQGQPRPQNAAVQTERRAAGPEPRTAAQPDRPRIPIQRIEMQRAEQEPRSSVPPRPQNTAPRMQNDAHPQNTAPRMQNTVRPPERRPVNPGLGTVEPPVRKKPVYMERPQKQAEKQEPEEYDIDEIMKLFK